MKFNIGTLTFCCLVTLTPLLAQAASDGAPGGIIKDQQNGTTNEMGKPSVDDKSLGEVTANTSVSAKKDDAISKQIRSALSANRALAKYAKKIKITVLNGVVTLSGGVATEAQKDKVEAAARHAKNVTEVKNEIVVL